MNDIGSLRLALRALTVFRGLRKDPLIKRLEALLQADKTAEHVEAYAAFAAELYTYGGNLTVAVLQRVLDDENIYALMRARDEAIEAHIKTCVFEELKILQAVSQLRSDELREWLGYDGFLPEWKTEKVDFVAAYEVHMTGVSKRGIGIFVRHHMFAVKNGDITPVQFADPVGLKDLKGYTCERQKVIDNTRALLQGKTASDVLLYGDAGTGKSSTVKAVVNAYRDEGLRLIEIGKHQCSELPALVEKLAENPLKFILFIDDLSFVEESDEYNAIKAMLQGSAFARPKNMVIYATSNRRHIVKETFSDRSGDDVHHNETIQEMISLSQRFGLMVGFFKPNKKQYLEIVHALKEEYGIKMDDVELEIEAERFASMGRTPRAARQLMEHLKRTQG